VSAGELILLPPEGGLRSSAFISGFKGVDRRTRHGRIGDRENCASEVDRASACVAGKAWYAGGTGVSNDPYLIYTAEQMNGIGVHEEDWAKPFHLMADIDLSGYSYGRAVIAPDVNETEGGF